MLELVAFYHEFHTFALEDQSDCIWILRIWEAEGNNISLWLHMNNTN